VEQATGVLMDRHGLTADTAAERIRRMAAHEGIAVGEVAARLVRRPPLGRRRRSGR
jgi:AmiR/NasT family two-component response regulator